MNPKNVLGLIEPDPINKNHIRVVLTMMGAPEGQGISTSTLADLLGLSKRTLGRLKPVLLDLGLAVIHPAPGSNDEDVWSITDTTRKQLTASEALDLSALSLGVGKPSAGPDPLQFGKRKYRSVLERDVAVCLTCLGVRHAAEFSYRKILAHKLGDHWNPESIPDWKCDFIVQVMDGQEYAQGVIEVAGVKGNPAYRAVIKQKELTLVPVGVPFLQLDDVANIKKIPEFIEALKVRAADLARSARVASSSSPAIPGSSYVTATGVHVDPRGVKKKLAPGEVRRPPPSLYPEAPAEDEVRLPMPVMTPEERELRRAKEALDEQRYEEEKIAVAAVRAKFKARWDAEDAKATSEDRVKMLAAALDWEDAKREPRKSGSRTSPVGARDPADEVRDREAPWEHSDLDEDGGLESSDGDISDHL